MLCTSLPLLLRTHLSKKSHFPKYQRPDFHFRFSVLIVESSRERPPRAMWLEITLALSQHWRLNEPIKQMAPDPSLAAAWKDVNKKKGSVNDPTLYSQHRPRQGQRKRPQKPNKYNKENTQVGGYDVGQITINGVTLCGVLFNDLQWKYKLCHFSAIKAHYSAAIFKIASLSTEVT